MNSEPEAAGKRENGKTRKRDGDSTVLLSEGKVGLAFSLAFSVFSLCALCSLWGLLAANASGAEVEIELQPEVAISTRQIYLRDIARIQTDDPALQRKLEAVMLGLAYTTERPRIITDFDVKSRMARQGLDADAFTFIGARAVVRYHAITITPEQILASARQFYLEQIGGENVGKAFQIEPRAPIRPMLVPDADVELRFVPINGDLWKGTLEVQAYYRGSEGAGRRGSGGASASALIPNPQPLTPVFQSEIGKGRVVSQQVLALNLSLMRPVVVAIQDIPRSTVIQAAHVKIEQRSVTAFEAVPLTALEAVIGKISKTPIRAGDAISTLHLEKHYLVSKGDTVTVVVQRGHLRIETKARALENGERGQVIRVMNQVSKKELTGEVIDGGVVRIHF